MTRAWHIRDIYERYRAGEISFDDVLSISELGIAEFEERHAQPEPPPRPPDPPALPIAADRPPA